MVSTLSTSAADSPPRDANAESEELLSVKDIRLGADVAIDGAWLAKLSSCAGRPRRGVIFDLCAVALVGKDAHGAWQGDGTLDVGASYPIVPGLVVRTATGFSGTLLFELLGRGVGALLPDGDGQPDDETTMSHEEGESTFPYIGIHFSETVAVRWQPSWLYAELAVTYHYVVPGTSVSWNQPSGTYVGIAVGGAREWIGRRQPRQAR